jgi:predicted component of type VI protein secretion system
MGLPCCCRRLARRALIWPRGLVVLRATSPAAALQQLHGRLGEALQALGLSLEKRRFRPHVTLARRAAGSHATPRRVELRWQVSSYTLVESLAGAAGGYRSANATTEAAGLRRSGRHARPRSAAVLPATRKCGTMTAFRRRGRMPAAEGALKCRTAVRSA